MNREFKLDREKLNKENKEVFNKIDYRLSGSYLHKNAYKNNIKEVLNMLLEGQKRNESYKEVIGEDLDGFCESIIENSYKTNVFERALRIIYLSNITILLPIIIFFILLSLLAEENMFLVLLNGDMGQVDIIPLIIVFIMFSIKYYIMELKRRTFLKKNLIAKVVGIIALIEIILVWLIYENLEVNYEVYVNNYLVLGISLGIVIFYNAYNFIVLRRFERARYWE